MKGTGERLAPIIDLARADVSGAEDCCYFVGGDHFSILGWHFGASERNMEITDNEGELTHLLLFGHVD